MTLSKSGFFCDFYPRPPGGGRLPKAAWRRFQPNFYPRPPGGGRPLTQSEFAEKIDFYPRPPGGGRPLIRSAIYSPLRFLSTPSGWRATAIARTTGFAARFLSTPSGWRATLTHPADVVVQKVISIHALRVEGDLFRRRCRTKAPNFYPRPPGGGRRPVTCTKPKSRIFLSTPSGWRATKIFICFKTIFYDFYPRPPGGGRP